MPNFDMTTFRNSYSASIPNLPDESSNLHEVLKLNGGGYTPSTSESGSYNYSSSDSGPRLIVVNPDPEVNMSNPQVLKFQMSRSFPSTSSTPSRTPLPSNSEEEETPDLPQKIQEQFEKLNQQISHELESNPNKAEEILKLISSYIVQELDDDLEQEELDHPDLHQVLKLNGGGYTPSTTTPDDSPDDSDIFLGDFFGDDIDLLLQNSTQKVPNLHQVLKLKGGGSGFSHICSLIYDKQYGKQVKLLLSVLVDYLNPLEECPEEYISAINRVETFISFLILFHDDYENYMYLLSRLFIQIREEKIDEDSLIQFVLMKVNAFLDGEEIVEEEDFEEEDDEHLDDNDLDDLDDFEPEPDLLTHLGYLNEKMAPLDELFEHLALFLETPTFDDHILQMAWIKAFIYLMMYSELPDQLYELIKILLDSFLGRDVECNERLLRFLKSCLKPVEPAPKPVQNSGPHKLRRLPGISDFGQETIEKSFQQPEVHPKLPEPITFKSYFIGSEEYKMNLKPLNGIRIIIRLRDGFFNATSLCLRNKLRGNNQDSFNDLRKKKIWTDYYSDFTKKYANEGISFISFVMKTPQKMEFLQGYYLDPRLFNFVASWAFKESTTGITSALEIMSSFHEQFKKVRDKKKPQNVAKSQISQNQPQISQISEKPQKAQVIPKDGKIGDVEVKTYHEKAGDFREGSYHGIKIYIHESNGFVNATTLCGQFETKKGNPKEFRQLIRIKDWKDEFYPEFIAEYGRNSRGGNSHGCSPDQFMEQINDGISNSNKFLRGQYVDPRMVNYIAMWASPKHSIYVGKIMDALNQQQQITGLNNSQLLIKLEQENTKLQAEKAKLEKESSKLRSEKAKLQTESIKLRSEKAELQTENTKLQMETSELTLLNYEKDETIQKQQKLIPPIKEASTTLFIIMTGDSQFPYKLSVDERRMNSAQIEKKAIYKFINSGMAARTDLSVLVPYSLPGEGKKGKKFKITEKQLPAVIHQIKKQGGIPLDEYKEVDQEYSGGSFCLYIHEITRLLYKLSINPEPEKDEKRFKKFEFYVKSSENPEEVRDKLFNEIKETRRHKLISSGRDPETIKDEGLTDLTKRQSFALVQNLIEEGGIVRPNKEPKPEKGPCFDNYITIFTIPDDPFRLVDQEPEPAIGENVEITISDTTDLSVKPIKPERSKSEVPEPPTPLPEPNLEEQNKSHQVFYVNEQKPELSKSEPSKFPDSSIPITDTTVLYLPPPEKPEAEETNKTESPQLVNPEGEKGTEEPKSEEYYETAGIVVYGEEEQKTPPHTPPPSDDEELPDDYDDRVPLPNFKAPNLHQVLKLRGGGGSLPPNLQPKPNFDADGNRIEEHEEEESEISEKTERKPRKPKYAFIVFQEKAGNFMVGDYHDIQIFIRMSDGYINATHLCGQFKTKKGEPKDFHQLTRNKEWKEEFYPAFCAEYGRNSNPGNSPPCSPDQFMVQIHAGISEKHKFLRGTYVHPKMINYIAMWASVAHSIYVGKIMDKLNEMKHVKELENQQLLSHLQAETIAEKERQLQEQQEKHDHEIAQIDKDYQEYLHDLEAKFQKQYDEQQKQHEQELDELHEYYQEDIRTIQKRIAEKEAQIEELEDEGEENQALIEELQAEIEDLKIHLEPLLKGKGSFYLFIHEIPGSKYKISVNPQPGTHEYRFRKYLFINQTPDEISDKDAQALMKLEFRSLTQPRTYAFSTSNLKKVERKMEELGGVQQAF